MQTDGYRYPDEKGTESPRVTTVTPMKRGLKVRAATPIQCALQPLPRF